MIKSSVQIKKALGGALADPKAIEQLIKKLEAQEKKSKASLKGLMEGKTKAKFVKDCEAKTAEAQEKLIELEYKANIIIDDATKKAAAITQDALDKNDAANEIGKRVVAELEAAKQVAKDARSEKGQTTKALNEARKERELYSKLRTEYEHKLTDLKTRFQGLIEE